GITGAELRVTAGAAANLIFQGETVESGAIQIGSALSGGTTIGFPACHSGVTIPVLTFNPLNAGGTVSEAELQVPARSQPSNPFLQCPVAVLCDDPQFTAVCVTGAKAFVNSSSQQPCEGGRVMSQWSRVKGMFR